MKKFLSTLLVLLLAISNILFAQQAGDLDSTFDGDGIVLTSFTPNSEYAHAIALQPDGKIVVAGNASNSIGTMVFYALARFNSDGSLDTNFDSDGLVTTSIGSNDVANALAIHQMGKSLLQVLRRFLRSIVHWLVTTRMGHLIQLLTVTEK